jgi:hypothetical protein
MGGLGRRDAQGQFMGGDFGYEDASSRPNPLHGDRIMCGIGPKSARSSASSYSCEVENVLDGKRNPVQRTAPPSCSHLGIGHLRRPIRRFVQKFHHRVKFGVPLIDGGPGLLE